MKKTGIAAIKHTVYLPVAILLVVLLLSACQLLLGPEPDTTPAGVLKSLWNDFNEIHAYLDVRMSHNMRFSNWHDVYYNNQFGYSRMVHRNMSDDALFNLCINMLRELNDPHVGLFAPGRVVSGNTGNRESFNTDVIKTLLDGGGIERYRNFLFGRLISEPQIGYIHISSFAGETSPEKKDWGRSIDSVIENLSDTSAVILDLRNNSGGDLYILEFIAARFISVPKEYLITSVRNGLGHNDFSHQKIHFIKPFGGYTYTKPVILLTNRGSASASERFTLALLTQSHVSHVGTPTAGAFSRRASRPMINGWYYSISPERVTDIQGNILEGIGIFPDEEHIVVYGQVQNNDDQINYAIKHALDRISEL